MRKFAFITAFVFSLFASVAFAQNGGQGTNGGNSGGLPVPGIGACPAGQVVDALRPSSPPHCVANGTGSFTATGTFPITSSGGSTPAIGLSGVSALQGNGVKVQLSTGSTTTNDCVKYDANGNTIDAGAACGSGGGGTPGGALHSVQINAGASFNGILCDINTVVYGQSSADPICSGTPILTSLTAAVNKVLNVQAPPYNATGDGTTDDYAAIQLAFYDACNTTNPPTGTPLLTATTSLYFPRGQYNHTKPFRIPCQNLTWYGEGPHYTKFKQTYAGDAFLIDSWGTNHQNLTATDFGTGNMLISPNGGSAGFAIDLSEYVDAPNPNNFATKCAASGCGVSIIYKPTVSSSNTSIFSSRKAYPDSGAGVFDISYGGTALTPAIRVNIGGVNTLIGTCPLNVSGTVYNLEWDWDKTTYYAFEVPADGVTTATLCGTVTSSTAPTQVATENMLLPPGGHYQYWPHGSSTQDNPFGGDIYSVKIETGPIHTAVFTGPSAKLTNDSSTYVLENFDTSLDGFQQAYRGGEVNPSIYFTVWNSGNIGYVSGMTMHDMELCVSNFTFQGMVVNDSNNSIFYNLGCGNAYYGGFQLGRQDFNSVFKDSTAFGGHFSLAMGDNFANGHVQNFQADGIDVACEVTSGGGGSSYIDENSRCTDRGGMQYCRIENSNAGASIDNFSIDQEGGAEPSWKGCILMNTPAGPYTFKGGNINTRNSAPYVIHQGSSAPGSTFIDFLFINFGGSTPASEVVHFTGTGSSTPYRLINPDLPVGNSGAGAKVPLTNLGPWSVILDDSQNVNLLNDTGTGTTINTLTKGVTAGSATTAEILATTDTASQVIGICKSYCGTAGTAQIQPVGAAKCVFDATAVTAGDWIQPSTVTAGNCLDSGVSSYTTTAPAGCLGTASETGAGSATRAVTLGGCR